MIREYIYIRLLYFYSHFLFYIHSSKEKRESLSSPLLRNFDFSLADKIATGTYNFVSLIVKIMILLALSLSFPLSLPGADKTQNFVHVSFDSALQLVKGISSDFQKLLKYFNGTAIAAFYTFH